MGNLTQKEMLEIILNEFKEYKVDWKDFKEKQDTINEMVIRHDEKIKGLWKVPTISGAVVTVITGFGVLISLLT
jgi:hypothetical protein